MRAPAPALLALRICTSYSTRLAPCIQGHLVRNAAHEGFCISLLAADPPGQQRENADDHGEGVVVDVSGLDLPQQRGGRADHLRVAVHEEPVDDRAISDV